MTDTTTVTIRSPSYTTPRDLAGLLPREAAEAVGVSQPVGSRWFRHGGGMPTVDLAPLSGRYLSFAEREEIAILTVVMSAFAVGVFVYGLGLPYPLIQGF